MEISETAAGEIWDDVEVSLASLFAGQSDAVLRMATMAAVIFAKFDKVSWCGFYLLQGARLLVGPYQGPVACLEIAKGKGVCGAVAEEGRSLVVPDVEAFPGHIACDAESKSEIVVPVWDGGGFLRGVLDLDSHQVGAFGEVDQLALEALVKRFLASADWSVFLK